MMSRYLTTTPVSSSYAGRYFSNSCTLASRLLTCDRNVPTSPSSSSTSSRFCRSYSSYICSLTRACPCATSRSCVTLSTLSSRCAFSSYIFYSILFTAYCDIEYWLCGYYPPTEYCTEVLTPRFFTAPFAYCEPLAIAKLYEA